MSPTLPGTLYLLGFSRSIQCHSMWSVQICKVILSSPEFRERRINQLSRGNYIERPSLGLPEASLPNCWALGGREPDWCLWFLPLGSLGAARIAVHPLPAVPVHVCGHSSWEPAHHLGHQHQHPSPHAHVRPPCQPVLCWHPLHLPHCAKGPREHPDPEQVHFLLRVPGSALLLLDFWGHGRLSPGHNGLWPLCSHLPPSPLHNGHELPALGPPGYCLLGPYGSCNRDLHIAHLSTFLLIFRDNSWLLLWSAAPHEGVLLWHSAQWACAPLLGGSSHFISLYAHPGLLYPHCLSHPWGALCPGKVQGLLYLWLPPGCCCPVLWNSDQGLSVPLVLFLQLSRGG